MAVIVLLVLVVVADLVFDASATDDEDEGDVTER